ncbi:IS4 family transposase [Laspinema sp. D1]|uniref:IS4 family transposase n=1 Tax=Laspinema palackyanum D2a TaxID=2953684 RepID=A0ABT2MWR3_9CYAN|nr:IS4 family transposase [Laspinema sp. D2a]
MSEFITQGTFRPQVQKSLAKAYHLAVNKSNLSFSQCMGNSFRQTVSGLFSHAKMNTEVMLSGHIEATRERVENTEGDYVIAPQDTTYYNYSGQKKMSGLGVIQGKVRGLMQHNVLLVNESGLPLGLLGQQYWTRKGGLNLPKGEKESSKWLKGLDAINQQASQSSKCFVAVEDREGDVFSLFKAPRLSNVELLVRVYQWRNLEVVGSQVVCKLPEVSSHLRDYGTERVRIYRHNREVELTLRLRAGAVNVYPEKDWSPSKHKTQGLSLVVAEEIGCLDPKTQEEIFCPKEAAIWYLLTSLPIDTEEQVIRVTRFYALRWQVERFHYTLKSGALQVEKLQFDDIHTLVNALAFYSVVGWKLLALTHAVRKNSDQSARAVFDESEVMLLQKVSSSKIVSIGEAVLALAKLIGFAPSKKQPFPGVKVLATALERFFFMKLGYEGSNGLADP